MTLDKLKIMYGNMVTEYGNGIYCIIGADNNRIVYNNNIIDIGKYEIVKMINNEVAELRGENTLDKALINLSNNKIYETIYNYIIKDNFIVFKDVNSMVIVDNKLKHVARVEYERDIVDIEGLVYNDNKFKVILTFYNYKIGSYDIDTIIINR